MKIKTKKQAWNLVMEDLISQKSGFTFLCPLIKNFYRTGVFSEKLKKALLEDITQLLIIQDELGYQTERILFSPQHFRQDQATHFSLRIDLANQLSKGQKISKELLMEVNKKGLK
jgi:hypothetical protein